MTTPLIIVVEKNPLLDAAVEAATRAGAAARRALTEAPSDVEVVALTASRRGLQNAVLLSHFEGLGFGLGAEPGARVAVLNPVRGLIERRPLRRMPLLTGAVALAVADAARDGYTTDPVPMFGHRPNLAA